MAQEIVNVIADALRRKGFNISIGDGVLEVGSYVVFIAEKRREPRVTKYRGFRKTEILKIRCSPGTKNAFYSYADKIGARTLEDALLDLLEKVGLARKIDVYASVK